MCHSRVALRPGFRFPFRSIIKKAGVRRNRFVRSPEGRKSELQCYTAFEVQGCSIALRDCLVTPARAAAEISGQRSRSRTDL
jgi:hypothetical protein